MTRPEPVITASEGIRFPKIYFAIKWTIITSLIFMGLLATAFWVLVLGEFSASGFRAPSPIAVTDESKAITPECAWPLSVDEPDAKAVCRMFYNLTPERRAWVLMRRNQ